MFIKLSRHLITFWNVVFFYVSIISHFSMFVNIIFCLFCYFIYYFFILSLFYHFISIIICVFIFFSNNQVNKHHLNDITLILRYKGQKVLFLMAVWQNMTLRPAKHEKAAILSQKHERISSVFRISRAHNIKCLSFFRIF